jgi:hypothetical protein
VNITHEAFTSAVVQEFRKQYQINTEVSTFWWLLLCFRQSQLFQCCVVEDSGGAKDIEFIRKGMLELSVNLLFIFLPSSI